MARDAKRKQLNVQALHHSGLEAIVCVSPTCVLLLTGYWPVMGASVALLKKDGEAVLLLPEDEVDLAKATSSATLVPYKPSTLGRLRTTAEALTEAAHDFFQPFKFGSGAIGITFAERTQTNPYLSSHHLEHTVNHLIANAFPGARLVACDELLARLQAIKTPTELDCIHRAADLAKVGFLAAREVIHAGRSEEEIAAFIESAFARIVNHGFERGHGRFFCMSGPNSTKAASAYARTRTRILQDGDLVMIHANTTGDGYWTDISRTYVVGEPNEKQKEMYAAIAEAREQALATIAAGAPAKSVDAAARGVLTRHGFGDAFKHSTGHGVGFAAADPNALPRLHPLSPDILQAGMTFNVEPAIYIEGTGGMRHCDVVACTNAGTEVFTNF